MGKNESKMNTQFRAPVTETLCLITYKYTLSLNTLVSLVKSGSVVSGSLSTWTVHPK